MTIYNDALLIAQKFRIAEQKVAEKCDGFFLFGLFERERTPGRWDIVVSAPWLSTDYAGTHEIIVLLRDNVDIDDWKLIGAVIPLEPSAEYVQWITSRYDLNHQLKEVFDTGSSRMSAGHAFLITANSNPSPVQTVPNRATAQPVAA